MTAGKKKTKSDLGIEADLDDIVEYHRVYGRRGRRAVLDAMERYIKERRAENESE